MKKTLLLPAVLMLCAGPVLAQPEQPVEQWTGRKILLIGAHPDDDSQSHGTLARLRDQGNEVWLVLMTLGNVGTKDPDISRMDLAKIRRREELAALEEIGIPEDHYVNLGYDDGRLEYADREEAIERLVFWIRTIQPDVLFAFDPGTQEQRWHKSDHRSAAYLAADAARAAEWPLLYMGHLVNHGLDGWQIPAYMFYDSAEEDRNTCVDVTDYVDEKIAAAQHYVSQWTSAFEDYRPDVPQSDLDAVADRARRRLRVEDGRSYECFRYYEGIPDGIGR